MKSVVEEHDGPLTFENVFYRATLQPDGTVSSLALQHSAAELLRSESIRANQLTAMDSTGLSPSNHELHVRERYQRPAAGPALHWVPAAPRVRRSPLGSGIQRSGPHGATGSCQPGGEFLPPAAAHRCELALLSPLPCILGPA